MRQAYAGLLDVARATQRQAARVGAALRAQASAPAQRLARQIAAFTPRLDPVMAQTVRRVLQGEAVPASEKLVSLFEPHTQIIVRHKAGQPVVRWSRNAG